MLSKRYRKRTGRKHNKKTHTKKHSKRVHKKTMRRNRHRRSRSRSRKYYQHGGKFNDAEEEQIKAKLREKGITDDAEINQMIQKLGMSSQQFAGPYFEQLLHQMNAMDSPEEMREFVENMNEFEENVETDIESDNEDD